MAVAVVYGVVRRRYDRREHARFQLLLPPSRTFTLRESGNWVALGSISELRSSSASWPRTRGGAPPTRTTRAGSHARGRRVLRLLRSDTSERIARYSRADGDSSRFGSNPIELGSLRRPEADEAVFEAW
jgi:hypothetical protein